ncbi:MAG: hypothetical protein CBD97_01930 [Pelagibacteraceae bacterium TMED237]|nr:MAG: hypothetical protein CBD97_01930 [Pelagibacteraceae bacterium TMED237]|tara:strand:- start:7610 stop:8386 length:777 start_codon:yes stop_codon:yes gene_type:complete
MELPSQVEIITDFPWNHNIEEMAKEIGEASRAYKLMHIAEARYAKNAYTVLIFLGIILGPMAGILNSIGIVLDKTNSPYFALPEICFGFFSGIVMAIIKFAKYDEVSHLNKSAAAKYASLESNIRRQLALSRPNRNNPESYLNWIDSKYDELIASAPLIPTHIYNHYEKMALKNGWKLPNQYASVISINTENINEEEKMDELLEIQKQLKKNNGKNNKIFECKRTGASKLSTITEINQFSDSMLEYEMNRLKNDSSSV